MHPLRPSNSSGIGLPVRPSSQDKLPLRFIQLDPFPHRQGPELEPSNPQPDEAQSRMTNRRGHPPDLAILSFDQFERDPGSGHSLAEADRWITGRDLRLRIENAHMCGQGFAPVDNHSRFEKAQRIVRRRSLDLNPVLSFVGAAWMKKSLVEPRFVAQ